MVLPPFTVILRLRSPEYYVATPVDLCVLGFFWVKEIIAYWCNKIPLKNGGFIVSFSSSRKIRSTSRSTTTATNGGAAAPPPPDPHASTPFVLRTTHIMFRLLRCSPPHFFPLLQLFSLRRLLRPTTSHFHQSSLSPSPPPPPVPSTASSHQSSTTKHHQYDGDGDGHHPLL